ncbi:MAG: membrane protein insertase YidC [Chlamydiota bacterium]|jgi:YidC/Oxa1 family membrane protein insertase
MDRRAILFIILVTLTFYGVNHFFSSKKTDETKEWINKKQIEKVSETPSLRVEAEPEQDYNEEFYVLENDYLQLVFSTRGGALAEVNLPLKSKQNPSSPINPIEVDRIISEKYPQNDFFPTKSYYVATDNGTQKIAKGNKGGYYPLLRRTIYNSNGSVYRSVDPKYYALNILSDDSNTDTASYKVRRFEKNYIEFELSQSNRRITKIFTLPEGPEVPFVVNLKVLVDGDKRNLWLTSGVPDVELISGKATPALKYEINKGKKTTVDKMKLPDATNTVTSVYPNWTSNSNGFFGLIVDPLLEPAQGYKTEKIDGNILVPRISLIDPEYNLYPAKNYPGYDILVPLANTSSMDFRVFAGPYESDILKYVDNVYSDPTIGYNPNYLGAQSFHGWFAFISEPFAKFLFVLMSLFHKITGSWGFSIILLTVVLRLMLYPLNAWSFKANARMQEVAPLAKSIQEKYKRDPKRAQMEVMKLYQEKKANPLMGCFPILIQVPFLIGMFDLLKSTFELRGASFIPGWITNLTAPDVLFSWNYPIIFFGTEFHLLPVLLGLVMYLQQKVTMKLPEDKSKWTDQQKQQKTVGNFMAILFLFMFYKFPSGLNIYWLSSSLLGMLQQYYNTKTMKKISNVPVRAYYSPKGKKKK